MPWSFRALVLSMTLACGLAPQIACLLPDEPLTSSEMDCCAKLATDCGQMNMSCCRMVVRTDAGITAKAIANLVPPHVSMTARPATVTSTETTTVVVNASVRNDHAPPYDFGASSTILRI
jgi:hypothetical protein